MGTAPYRWWGLDWPAPVGCAGRSACRFRGLKPGVIDPVRRLGVRSHFAVPTIHGRCLPALTIDRAPFHCLFLHHLFLDHLFLHHLFLHRLFLHRLFLHRLFLHRLFLHRLPIPPSKPCASISTGMKAVLWLSTSAANTAGSKFKPG
ncbi:hypothetical protein BZA05DRAFT_240452 [Tricharina praecox]|uniref:uncharacterized protein n=1 Tax=Tricharina praecox TaxID=43433 RepID=UPI0022208598|nr:uncharacterized protein BZA05DRAFT_240452 [Tricharina praecox]KAI5855464.1 hypothetical protein BZA05DRAFT_240452 [Tricharina praecox]